MKAKKMWRPIAMGLAAALLVAMPASAEESRAELEKVTEQADSLLPGQPAGNENIKMATQEEVNSYVGQTVTKISIVGDSSANHEQITDALKLKPGQTFSKEALTADLQAIYELGWFYDIIPAYTQVPEGVQLTYHVLENPVFKNLVVEGNTKVSSDKIAKIMDLQENKLINIKAVNENVRKVEAEYAQAGYILARITDVRVLPSGELYLFVNEGIVEEIGRAHV